MFKLTRKEAQLVALLAGALVLGTVVKEWRARQGSPPPAARVETNFDHGED